MKSSILTGIIFCSAFCLSAALGQNLLIYNAKIHTVDDAMPAADSMVISENGLILDVGREDHLWPLYPHAKGLDLKGQMVLPGFQDVHMHALEASINAEFCVLSQFGDAATYKLELKDCLNYWQGEPWVMGAGVNMSALLENVDNPLALIDAAIPNTPALIIDDIGHGAWANTLALKQAGLFNLTQNPNGGMLVRQDDGSLTGVVYESLSQTLMDVALPDTFDNRIWALDSLENALKVLAENGITSISDAGGYWPRGHDKVWQEAEDQRLMTVRASNALYVYPDKDMETQIEQLISRKVSGRDKLARMDQVKIYVDGILTQGTGLLNEPYTLDHQLPEAEPNGFAYFDTETLNAYAKRLSDAGFQLHFHTTGDKGTDLALDAIAQANPKSGPHRITHLYLVDLKSIQRFKTLGVVADYQIAPSSIEPDYEAYVAEFIGKRADHLLAINSMLESGALVTLSSDWDADELDPLIKLETVLTRDKQVVPDLKTAIRLMTLNPAILLRHDDKTGSISKGKYADLVVINKNLFDLEPHQISEAEIVATLFAGQAVYDPKDIFD